MVLRVTVSLITSSQGFCSPPCWAPASPPGGGGCEDSSRALCILSNRVKASLELVGLLLELLGGGGTLARLVLGNEFTESGNLLLDGLSLGLVELVFELLEGLLGIVQDAVGTVGSLNGSLALLVCSAYFSASSTMFWISVSERPEPEAMVMD